MNKRTYKLMNWAKIEEIVYSESDNPHEILGAHVTGSSVLVQTFQPGAKSVRLQLLDGDKSYRMEEADEEGYFALLLPGKGGSRLRVCGGGGKRQFEKDAGRLQLRAADYQRGYGEV